MTRNRYGRNLVPCCLGLIELNRTLEPWRRYALYWAPFLWHHNVVTYKVASLLEFPEKLSITDKEKKNLDDKLQDLCRGYSPHTHTHTHTHTHNGTIFTLPLISSIAASPARLPGTLIRQKAQMDLEPLRFIGWSFANHSSLQSQCVAMWS